MRKARDRPPECTVVVHEDGAAPQSSALGAKRSRPLVEEAPVKSHQSSVTSEERSDKDRGERMTKSFGDHLPSFRRKPVERSGQYWLGDDKKTIFSHGLPRLLLEWAQGRVYTEGR